MIVKVRSLFRVLLRALSAIDNFAVFYLDCLCYFMSKGPFGIAFKRPKSDFENLTANFSVW